MLKIKDLYFKYKREDKWLFENINIELSSGLWLLNGKNGSGKSTFLNLIMDSEIYSDVLGEMGEDTLIEKPDTTTFIGKETKVLGRVKEYDFVKYILKLNDISDMSGYKPLYDKPLSEYSVGEEKMVVLKILSYIRPKLILIDEYICNLDNENLDYALKLLNEIANMGSTVIVASNEEDIKNRFKNRIAIEGNGVKLDKSY